MRETLFFPLKPSRTSLLVEPYYEADRFTGLRGRRDVVCFIFLQICLINWDYSSNREVFLVIGKQKTNVKIVEKSGQDNSYFIQQGLRVRLNLSGIQQPLAFYFNESSEELRIGPVIGILVSAPVPLLEEKSIFLFEKVAEEAFHKGIICYFFTPDFIDLGKKTISAFIYRKKFDSSQEWIMQDFPLPEIVYNQVGIISPEMRPLYGKIMKQYSQEKRTVNPFLALNDKLINYNNLQKYPPVRKFC